ncbi:Cytochrome c oxidase copper chaperone [Orbilia oligospora]|uniref:Cytochrome c oxidase copper chaperone n=1 Tax=Orbilia oligospora TaxID=2813651 RepID=A0A7C8NBZ1_ORBOL|nr:Cytochrome c oxidase copper chaperone [Orbilia oligospora]KAF3097435.1 Cytochrome c oxidase copper chaperone [Orbilia oligospora]KAF3126915.1 Cytochrome c oxidase copper chaperone [Orbilia oligospora]
MLDFLFGSKPKLSTTTDNDKDKPKPCCVCKPEKSARDECMLKSTTDTPEVECKDLIKTYKACMEGFGFKV